MHRSVSQRSGISHSHCVDSIVVGCLSFRRQKLKGHKKTVEDLVFQPNSTTSLASVGDDAQVGVQD